MVLPNVGSRALRGSLLALGLLLLAAAPVFSEPSETLPERRLKDIVARQKSILAQAA